MNLNVKLYVLTTVILLALLLIFGAIAGFGEKPVNVTIIDNIFDGMAKHDIGIAKFVLDDEGEKVDYRIIGRTWSERKKVLKLRSGSYGATASKIVYLLNPYANKYIKTRSIISYIEFTVKESDTTVYLDPGRGI